MFRKLNIFVRRVGTYQWYKCKTGKNCACKLDSIFVVVKTFGVTQEWNCKRIAWKPFRAAFRVFDERLNQRCPNMAIRLILWI